MKRRYLFGPVALGLAIARPVNAGAQTSHDSLAAYADLVVRAADSAYREMQVLTLLQSTDFAMWGFDREKHPPPFSMDSVQSLVTSRQTDVKKWLLEFDSRPAPALLVDIHRLVADEFQTALANMDSLASAAFACDLGNVHNQDLAQILFRRCSARFNSTADRLRAGAKAYALARDRIEARLKVQGINLPCKPDPDEIVGKAANEIGKPPCRP